MATQRNAMPCKLVPPLAGTVSHRGPGALVSAGVPSLCRWVCFMECVRGQLHSRRSTSNSPPTKCRAHAERDRRVRRSDVRLDGRLIEALGLFLRGFDRQAGARGARIRLHSMRATKS